MFAIWLVGISDIANYYSDRPLRLLHINYSMPKGVVLAGAEGARVPRQ